MDGLEQYLPYLGLPTTVIMIAMPIKIGIDSFYMTGVERKISTDSDKILATLSQILLVDILYSILIVIWTVYFEKIIIVEDLSDLLVLFIFSLFLMLIITLPLYIIIFSFMHLIKIKTVYYFKGIDDDKWYIIRRVDKDKLLLSNKKKYIFMNIEDLNELGIYTEYRNREHILKYSYFYLMNKNTEIIKWILAIMIMFACYWANSIAIISSQWGLIIFCIVFLSACSHSFVSYSNKQFDESFEKIYNERIKDNIAVEESKLSVQNK